MTPIMVPGTVVRVTDGDTVHVRLELKQLGVDPVDRRVRFRDINADEPGTETGDKATAYLTDLLSVNEAVFVEAWEADQFGRVIGDIRLGNHHRVSTLMLKAGVVTTRPKALRLTDLVQEDDGA